jgi:hypothetical protein
MHLFLLRHTMVVVFFQERWQSSWPSTKSITAFLLLLRIGAHQTDLKWLCKKLLIHSTLLKKMLIYHWADKGPIFLRRFKVYMFSFTFWFMFANICFEKNQNSKIYVMFIINITWNETGICSFWAVLAVRAVGKNQVLTCASFWYVKYKHES